MALSLTFAAGFVDIVGFLTVYEVFTAHMTGTTVHMAEQLSRGELEKAAAGAVAVGAFLAGSISGRIIIELGARSEFRQVASIVLAIEAALIASVWPTASFLRGYSSSNAAIWLPLGMLAAAMGMQTAALTRIGPLTIHTTFVTGMLNRLAELMASVPFRRHDVRHAKDATERAAHRRKLAGEQRESYFVSAIWLMYVAGAASGTAMAEFCKMKALYLPCVLLIAAIAIDQYHPLSVDEEREQLQV